LKNALFDLSESFKKRLNKKLMIAQLENDSKMKAKKDQKLLLISNIKNDMRILYSLK